MERNTKMILRNVSGWKSIWKIVTELPSTTRKRLPLSNLRWINTEISCPMNSEEWTATDKIWGTQVFICFKRPRSLPPHISMPLSKWTGERKDMWPRSRLKVNVDPVGVSLPLGPLRDSTWEKLENLSHFQNKIWLIVPVSQRFFLCKIWIIW